MKLGISKSSYNKCASIRLLAMQLRAECMFLFNTTVFDGSGIYSIYYIRYSYMFRRLKKAIFRLDMKYLVSSYMRIITGCKQWYSTGGEVGTRSGKSWRVGGVGTWGVCCYILCLS